MKVVILFLGLSVLVEVGNFIQLVTDGQFDGRRVLLRDVGRVGVGDVLFEPLRVDLVRLLRDHQSQQMLPDQENKFTPTLPQQREEPRLEGLIK